MAPRTCFRVAIPPTEGCAEVAIYLEEGRARLPEGSIHAPRAIPAHALLIAGSGVSLAVEEGGTLIVASAEQARPCAARTELVIAEGTRHRVSDDLDVTLFALEEAPEVRPHVLSFSILSGSPAMQMPEHLHAGSEEALLWRSGDGVLRVDGAPRAVAPGEEVLFLRGALHAYFPRAALTEEPSGGTRFEAFQALSPSGPERRFVGLPPPR